MFYIKKHITLNNLAEEKNAFSEINLVLDKNLVDKNSGYDNFLSEEKRQDAFRTGKKIRLKLEPNPNFREDIWPVSYTFHKLGRYRFL